MQSLLSSHMEKDGGKSLFAHYFPGDSPHRLGSTASSSQIAWQATKGHQLCKDLFTHQGWASWCGAVTKGAVVKLPLDPDGLCIHMRLQSGKLLRHDTGTGNTVIMWSRVPSGTGTGSGSPYPSNTIPISTVLRVCRYRHSGQVSDHLTLLIR